ncbi:MAG: hypothetical protein ACREF7_01085 [Candidatus Saccharimonadales bacterium]
MKKQSGFAVVELIVLGVVVVAIAAVGYYVIKNHNTNSGQSTANFINSEASTNLQTTTPTVSQINSTPDLSSALNALNQTNIGANTADSGQLSTQSSGL